MPSFFQSLASLFSGSTNTRESLPISAAPSARSRRTAVKSPTRDAFSLPTHSPIFGDTDSPHSMNVASSSSTAFSYPPTRSSYDYDYPMTSASSTAQGLSQALSADTGRGRPLRQDSSSPILPMHHNSNSNSLHLPLSPLQAYPPLDHTWNRLRSWLNGEYTELGDTLNYGIPPAVISSVQMELGLPLPSAVRDSYLVCDGQEVESSAGCSDGLFFGLSLLPLEDVLEEWRFWREVDDDPATGANARLRSVMKSIPDGYVRKEYSCRGWLPLVTDRAGNYLGVDLHPGDGGTYGQVIVFGRDFDTKIVMWRGEGEGGWGRWLAGFVDELENGEGYEMGGSGDGSSGSEDEVGYESYFYSPNGIGRNDGEGRTGGLRLTGEYKGWNVLEAWADRSVKRWTQAGLYKEEPTATITKPEIEITDAAAVVSDTTSSAEVPIPVLGDVQVESLAVSTQDLPPSTDPSVTPTTPRPTITPTNSQPPPAISVTVPVLPKPTAMPTTLDLLSDNSPISTTPNSPRLSDEDLQHQRLSSAPTTELMGKTRYASEESSASMDSSVAVTVPLVRDTSFSSAHQEGSMMEAPLVALVEDGTETGSTEDPSQGDVIFPAAQQLPSPPALSPPREELELKTPTALHFPASTLGDLYEPKEGSALLNGTAEPNANGTIIPPPPPKSNTPRLHRRTPPTPTVSSPTTVPLPPAADDIGSPNSRPGTPNSFTSVSSATKRLQKGLHKKSTKSITKLFGGGGNSNSAEKDTSSLKGSDDESSVKEKKEKRGSTFGSPFRSKMLLGKDKKKSAAAATVADAV